MNDNWNDPYRKLQAVEEQSTANHLVELYQTLYKKKFRAEPIFPHTNAHTAQLKAFVKAVGTERAYAILQAYFQMNEKWFIEQHYSIDCLMKNLNKINVKAVRGVEHREKVEAIVHHPCDACGTIIPFVFSDSRELLDKPVYCRDCSESGRIMKSLNKTERRAIVLRLGNAFPELPNEPAAPSMDGSTRLVGSLD